MSRTQRGSKPAGYEYWSKRPGNKNGNLLGPGRLAKKLTHSRERLKCNKVQYAHEIDCQELCVIDGYDSHPGYVANEQA